MAQQQPVPNYAQPVLLDEAAKTPEERVSRARFNPIWLKWFIDLGQILNSAVGSGTSILHNLLGGLQGGTASQYYHLTSAEHSVITGAKNTNWVLAGPATGPGATADFRALVNADLPATAVTPATYTYATITVNQQGVLTAASSGTAPVTSISVTAPLTTTGGTTPSLGMVNQGTTTTVLHGNAAGNPSWGSVALTTDVSGTLPVGNGGTGATTLTQHGVILGNGTSTVAVTAGGTTRSTLHGVTGADPEFSTNGADFTNIALLGTAGTGYLDFPAQSANPASPAAGTLRFHSATTQGFTRFEQDNEAPTNLVLGRDNVFIAKNTSGGNIAAGKAVYITGSTGNVPNIALAKADSLTTLPAIGVTLDPINNNNFGQIMKLGIIASIDTSAFTTGNLLYVSSSTAGAFTATRPSYPSYAQPIANVLVSGVGNGSLHIITAPFVDIGLVPYSGATGNVDLGVYTIKAAGHMQQMGVTAGQTTTIPAGYCLVSSGPFDIAGVLDAAGVLEII